MWHGAHNVNSIRCLFAVQHTKWPTSEVRTEPLEYYTSETKLSLQTKQQYVMVYSVESRRQVKYTKSSQLARVSSKSDRSWNHRIKRTSSLMLSHLFWVLRIQVQLPYNGSNCNLLSLPNKMRNSKRRLAIKGTCGQSRSSMVKYLQVCHSPSVYASFACILSTCFVHFFYNICTSDVTNTYWNATCRQLYGKWAFLCMRHFRNVSASRNGRVIQLSIVFQQLQCKCVLYRFNWSVQIALLVLAVPLSQVTSSLCQSCCFSQMCTPFWLVTIVWYTTV